jgi:hypothetical protein
MPIDERARGFDQANFNQTGPSYADAKSTFATFLGRFPRHDGVKDILARSRVLKKVGASEDAQLVAISRRLAQKLPRSKWISFPIFAMGINIEEVWR